VFQDELELPPGKVRVKVWWQGIAGHNGLRSISSHIGNDYRRVRLGIGHPGIRELVQRSRAVGIRQEAIGPGSTALCKAVADNAGLLTTERDSTFQNRVHLALQATGLFDKGDDGAAYRRRRPPATDFRTRHGIQNAVSSGCPNVGKSTLFHALTETSQRRRRRTIRSAPSSRMSARSQYPIPGSTNCLTSPSQGQIIPNAADLCRYRPVLVRGCLQ